MGSLLIIILWTLFIIGYRVLKKPIFGLVLLTLFVIPTMAVAGKRISGLYYWGLVLLVVAFSFQKAYTISNMWYIVSLLIIISIYGIGCIVNGTGNFLNSVIGSLKFFPIIIAFDLIFSSTDNNDLNDGMNFALDCTAVLNIIVVVLQKIIPVNITKILDMFFYNDDSLNFTDGIADNTMVRAFGIYNHPAVLAMVSLVLFSFYLTKISERKINKLFLLVSFVLGISSASKTFVLGFPIILATLWLYRYGIRINKKTILLCGLLVVLLTIMSVNFDSIILLIAHKNPYQAYYLGMLKNPLAAFYTRYDSKEGSLAQLYAIIFEHPIIGVGPNSINGERINDSAPLQILHNGGLLSFVVALYTLFNLLFRSIKINNETSILFIVIVLISGFALPTWIFHYATIGIIEYVLLSTSGERV